MTDNANEIQIGSVWVDKNDFNEMDPWNVNNIIRLTVTDVKDGWVKLLVQSPNMPIEIGDQYTAIKVADLLVSFRRI